MAPSKWLFSWQMRLPKPWRKHVDTDPFAHPEDEHTKLCNGCGRRLPLGTRFWSFRTCNHAEAACGLCLLRHIHNQLRRNPTWDACTCPLCDKPIPEVLLKSTLHKGTVFLFDGFIFFLRRLYRARLCACPSCGTERYLLPEVRSSPFKCSFCSHLICMNHGIQWDQGVEGHKGISCSEYDYGHADTVLERSSIMLIMSLTKPCPYCGIRVSKSNLCTKSVQQCKLHHHVAELLTDGSQVHTVTAGGIGMRLK